MAARGMGHVVVVGHLAKDAEVEPRGKYFKASFIVVVNRYYPGREREMKREQGDSSDHDVVGLRCNAWNLGEVQAGYLKQGRQVGIIGNLKSHNDQGRFPLTVEVEEMLMLDPRERAGQNAMLEELEKQVGDYERYIAELQKRNGQLLEERETALAEIERLKLANQNLQLAGRNGVKAELKAAAKKIAAPGRKGTRK